MPLNIALTSSFSPSYFRIISWMTENAYFLLSEGLCMLFPSNMEIICNFRINKQKMNNTKSSRLSVKAVQPSNFRVFLKQRSNHLEPTQQLTNNHFLRLSSKGILLKKQKTEQSGNLADMKDYVRNRLNTDYQMTSTQDKFHQKQNSKEEISSFNKTFADQLQNSETKKQMRASQSDFSVKLNRNTTSNQPCESEHQSTLKALEERVEGLLFRKLQHCGAFKNEINQNLEEEMSNIIKHIKELKESNPQNTGLDSTIINKKINLLEKLMAENMAEADIMKKYMLSRISNKPKVRRLKTEDVANKDTQYTYRDAEMYRQPVTNTSISHDTFKTPEKCAYDIFRYKQVRFNAGRDKQPLPRSSYSRQYLIYDPVKDSEIIPINNVIMSRSNSANMFSSSYRDSFGPKQTSRVNIKELDACKNKIKNIPIDFSRKVKATKSLLRYDFTKEPIKKTRYEQPLKISGKYLLSESRREYNKDAGNYSRASIKHENLTKLRYQYKNIALT